MWMRTMFTVQIANNQYRYRFFLKKIEYLLYLLFPYMVCNFVTNKPRYFSIALYMCVHNTYGFTRTLIS